MTHPLTNWLLKNGESLQQFAKRIGVNASTVQRLMYGKTDVSTTLIRAVSEGTGRFISERRLYMEWLKAHRARQGLEELAD